MDALDCRKCGAALNKDSIDEDLGVISCGHCGAIFERSQSSGPGGAEVSALSQKRIRAQVPLPDAYVVIRDQGGLSVSWRWYQHRFLIFGLLALGYNAFVLKGFEVFLRRETDVVEWMMLGMLALLAVWGTYFSACLLINQTTVSVRDGLLDIRQKPIPTIGSLKVTADSLDQLFVIQEIKASQYGACIFFTVCALKRDQSTIRLIKGFGSLDQALWMEQEIEKTLGIRDRVVPGEFQVPVL